MWIIAFFLQSTNYFIHSLAKRTIFTLFVEKTMAKPTDYVDVQRISSILSQLEQSKTPNILEQANQDQSISNILLGVIRILFSSSRSRWGWIFIKQSLSCFETGRWSRISPGQQSMALTIHKKGDLLRFLCIETIYKEKGKCTGWGWPIEEGMSNEHIC